MLTWPLMMSGCGEGLLTEVSDRLCGLGHVKLQDGLVTPSHQLIHCRSVRRFVRPEKSRQRGVVSELNPQDRVARGSAVCSVDCEEDGSGTHPCGAPVLVTLTSDRVLPTLTFCRLACLLKSRQ